jgi:predicted PurR-regulated permease PerM
MNMTIAAIVIGAFGVIMAIIWQVQTLAKMIQQDTHKRIDDLKRHIDERLEDKFQTLRAEFKSELGPANARLGNVEQRLIDLDRRGQRIEEVIFKPVLPR